VLVRTGKFGGTVERALTQHDGSSLLDLAPARVAGGAPVLRRRHRPDRDRAHPPLARALCRLSATAASPRPSRRTATRVPTPARAMRPLAGKEAVGRRLGFGVARAFAWRDRDSWPAQSRRSPVGGAPRVAERSRELAGDRPLDDALARARAGRESSPMPDFEPLLPSEEMRAPKRPATISISFHANAPRAEAERLPDRLLPRSFGRHSSRRVGTRSRSTACSASVNRGSRKPA